MKRDYDKFHRRNIRHNHDRQNKDSDQSEAKKISAKLEVKILS